MSLNDLANLGQIIGAIAVVVSLFYVAHQIRQNTYAVRSPPLKPCMSTLRSGTIWSPRMLRFPKLSRTDCVIMHRFRNRREFVSSRPSWRSLSYSQNAFLKWHEGLLASPLWRGWELVIMNLVCAPGGKAFWKDRSYMFGDQFRGYVEDDLMKREPHPDAKPMGAFPIS